MATSRNDRITVAGIKLHPRIGVTPGERRLPQPCQADITLWCDLAAAAATDSLDKTTDYSRVIETVRTVAHSQEFNLVEALAYRLARKLLETYPVKRVNIRLRKRPVSLIEKIDFIEVELEES
jgi:dihydroneopterin aldolase